LRRGCEQAVLIGREQPWQRVAPLDDLEQGLLLTEQVLLGAGDDRDGDGTRETGLLHLLDRSGHALLLPTERRLERDERLARADRQRRDRDALDDRVRVRAHEGTVLERGGLTLRAVGHHVAVGAGRVQDRRPLAPRREPATPATAQPREGELLHRLRGPQPRRLL